MWFASFTAALGSKNKKKDLNYGIIGGTIAVCVAIGLIAFAQIANVNTGANGTYIWNADIPNLILATKIWKPFSAIFAIVVFAGIYTTAVPLLYNPVSRFAKEGTPRFKILTVVLGVAGLIRWIIPSIQSTCQHHLRAERICRCGSDPVYDLEEYQRLQK